MNDILLRIVDTLNTCPTELIAFLMILCCVFSIFSMYAFFGQNGLCLYLGVALILSNVLFLKLVNFSFYSDPVPLGKIVIGSTMFCTSLLTEFYGKETARRAILMGLMIELMAHFLMLLAIGVAPRTSKELDLYNTGHMQIKALFLPTFSIFLSGVIAYLISQYMEVKTFLFVKHVTKNRFLWLRAGTSMCVASLLDNIIFSVLACVVFAPHPASWQTVIFTYILGTYLIRCMICILFLPWLYLMFINPLQLKTLFFPKINLIENK